MEELIITRSDWLRGGETYSWLLRGTDRHKCCLGFLALKLGYSESDIENEGCPTDLANSGLNLFPDSFFQSPQDGNSRRYDASDLLQDIVKANDDSLLSEECREEKLIELFSKFGYDLKFTD